MQITNTANGKSQYGKARDECEGCGQYDIGKYYTNHFPPDRREIEVHITLIDLSPSLFESLGADLSVGVLQVEWHFENKDFQSPN